MWSSFYSLHCQPSWPSRHPNHLWILDAHVPRVTLQRHPNPLHQWSNPRARSSPFVFVIKQPLLQVPQRKEPMLHSNHQVRTLTNWFRRMLLMACEFFKLDFTCGYILSFATQGLMVLILRPRSPRQFSMVCPCLWPITHLHPPPLLPSSSTHFRRLLRPSTIYWILWKKNITWRSSRFKS